MIIKKPRNIIFLGFSVPINSIMVNTFEYGIHISLV